MILGRLKITSFFKEFGQNPSNPKCCATVLSASHWNLWYDPWCGRFLQAKRLALLHEFARMHDHLLEGVGWLVYKTPTIHATLIYVWSSWLNTRWPLSGSLYISHLAKVAVILISDPFLEMSADSLVSSMPSNGWSCETLQQGVEAAAKMAGIQIQPAQLQQAWQWSIDNLFSNQIVWIVLHGIHRQHLTLYRHIVSCIVPDLGRWPNVWRRLCKTKQLIGGKSIVLSWVSVSLRNLTPRDMFVYISTVSCWRYQCNFRTWQLYCCSFLLVQLHFVPGCWSLVSGEAGAKVTKPGKGKRFRS